MCRFDPPTFGSEGRTGEVAFMRETLIETEVTYRLGLGGKSYIVEHVSARVCQETGEQFFAPETVERIQAFIKEGSDYSKTTAEGGCATDSGPSRGTPSPRNIRYAGPVPVMQMKLNTGKSMVE
jgi:YgiT-type zinc finger domain-containing protein